MRHAILLLMGAALLVAQAPMPGPFTGNGAGGTTGAGWTLSGTSIVACNGCTVGVGATVLNAVDPSVITSGLTCDGNADNQTALATPLAAGKAVVLPAGQCNYSGTLTLASGARLIGQGSGRTTLRKTGHGIGISVSGASDVARVTGTELRGFNWVGDGSANSGDYGIQYHHANTQHILSDVQVRSAGDIGLLFKGDCFEIRGHDILLGGNLGADQVLFQKTPDAPGEAANDITINNLYVVPAAGTRVAHFAADSQGNIINGLIIQSPAAAVESVLFAGANTKWNKIFGLMTYDSPTATTATAFAIFNAATENEIHAFHGGLTGVPIFSFAGNAAGNIVFGGEQEGTPTAIYTTDAGSAVESIFGWTSSTTEAATSTTITTFISRGLARFNQNSGTAGFQVTGIGGTNPLLTVTDGTATAKYQICTSCGEIGIFGMNSNHRFEVVTNNTVRAFFGDTGYVNIGTNNSAVNTGQTLNVKDSTASTGATRVQFDLGATDALTTNIFTVAGKMTASGGIVLPTSCTGLSAGVLWNNAGTPAICP